MENRLVLRLVFFVVGFLAFSQCEEERVIQIKIDNNNVYRNAYYVTGSSARLSCNPPMDSKNNYDELGIYLDKDSTDPYCKGSNKKNCNLSTGANPSLSMNIDKSGHYFCKYGKAPEPPVQQAEVRVYFKKQEHNMRVTNENNQTIYADSRSAPIRVTNESIYELVCPDAGQTETKVHWYRNEHELKFDHGNPFYEFNDTTQALKFKKLKSNPDSSKFGGWYRCERFSKENQFLLSSYVKIENYAHVSAASKSYNKMEGESATLSCEVDGEPMPEVSWRRGDKTWAASSDDDRVTLNTYKGIRNASITIKNLVAEDYGEYICVAKGQDGSYAEAPTLLRVRSKLAALWPFLGIVAEVIILVVIIFIYEKRRAKKEREENEDAADQKKSLTASNNENKDVRQRKA